MVCFQLQRECDCGCKPLFAIGSSGDKAALEEDKVPVGWDFCVEGSGNEW